MHDGLQKNILVVIPAYNEEASLAQVVCDVREAGFEDIAVVNDGSADGTQTVAESLGVILLNHPFNLGVGAAIQTGCKFAEEMGYDFVVQVDGDGQHDPHQIPRLIEAVDTTGADLIVGSRFLEGPESYRVPRSRRIGILILAWVISLIVRRRMTDTTSGFRAINRHVIEYFSHHYPTDYPEPESSVLLHREGFQVGEVSCFMFERRGGNSSIGGMTSISYMIKVLLAILINLFRTRTVCRRTPRC